MKLAFSTLGCPLWPFNDIIATAKDIGMDGVEIRGLGTQMYVPKTEQFSEQNIENTKSFIKKTGLFISMLTSDAAFNNEKTIEQAIKEAKEYIALAEKIDCKYIRVMGEPTVYPGEKLDLGLAGEAYGEVLDYAKDKGVFPLIETNGALADTKVMAKFIKSLNRSNAFVLWDIHHPYRVFSETAEYSGKNLEGLVKYLHVKDSVMKDGKIVYKMMGHGDVPLLECLRQLKKTGYDSYISLEWVKRWQPDLLEPGIVFSHYANYINKKLQQL